MNQMGIECILHYSSIQEIFDLEIDHPDHLKHIKEESKKLQRRTHDTSKKCGMPTNKSTPRLEMR